MKRSNGWRRICIIAGVACVLGPGTGRASLVDYNTPGDLTTRFNLNVTPPNTIKYTQIAAGGLGNSGAADLLGALDADHTTAVFNGGSWGFATPGDSVSVSQFILRKDAILTSTPFMQMGILSDQSERLDSGAAGNSYASVRIVPLASAVATDVQTVVETKVNGGARLRTTVVPVSTLTAGHWYLLTTTFAYNSGSDLLVSGALEDWGVSGAAFSSSTFSFGPTLISLSGLDQVNGDSSVWAGYRGFNEGGSDLFDDFSAVPEPFTAGLLAVAGLLISRRRG